MNDDDYISRPFKPRVEDSNPPRSAPTSTPLNDDEDEDEDDEDEGDQGGKDEGVSLADFFAYMPMHSYIFAPTNEMWPATSVNARLPPMPIPGAENSTTRANPE